MIPPLWFCPEFLLFWLEILFGSFAILTSISFLFYPYPHPYWTNSYWEQIMSNSRLRLILSNRCFAMVHSLSTIYLVSINMYYQPSDSLSSTPWQISIMQYSVSYFIIDIIYICLMEFDIKYLIHHIISITFYFESLYTGYGQYYAMIGLLLAEITNPFQLVWEFTRKNKMRVIFDIINPIHTYFYIMLRSIVIPYKSIPLIIEIATHPLYEWRTSLIYLICTILFELGGILWCISLWRGYLKYCRNLAKEYKNASYQRLFKKKKEV